MSEQRTRKFGANNGVGLGWFVLLLGVVSIAVMVVTGMARSGFPVIVGIALMMAVVWAVAVRPMVMTRGDDLVLRHAFSDVSIPLAAVDFVQVRLFTVVAVGDKRFHSPAVGRTRKQVVHHGARSESTGGDPSLADLVEEQLNELAVNARRDKLPTEPITRTPARVPIGVVVVLALVLVAAILL
ncbi:hypothetical protein ASG90_02880 [Nocardioides sp. Soil797]|nr:hypothetical protein ASG90_02880 [Nocardioides sp. Soil797]